MMVHKYVVKDNDSIQKIAVTFFNDPKRWVDIVSYNRLDYPFITADQNFVTNIRASGTITLSGNGIAVPKGTRVWTSSIPTKRYETLTAVSLVVSSEEVSVVVRSLLEGEHGNAVAGSVDSIGIANVTVSQPDHITNGRRIRVRKTGENLFILTDTPVNIDLESFLERIGSEDLLLENGDFSVDIYRDLTSVSGVANIAQRIRHRIATERGELPLHPTYGSNLYQLIAREEPYIDEMIKLEVQQVILEDPAVEEVESVTVTRKGTVLFYDCLTKLGGYHEVTPLSGTITL